MESDNFARQLIFIRHAAVQRNPEMQSREWPLSDDGRSQVRQLAQQLALYGLTRIVTSDESKARETGQIIADELGLPCQTGINLHEHDRQGAPFFTSQEAFEAAVARFFQNPDTLVFGRETADQAFSRFDTAVRHLLAAYPSDTLAIVTHGTVLTLFLAHYNRFAPFAFWQKMNLPDCYAVSLPDMCL